MLSYGRVRHLDFFPSGIYSLALHTMPSARQGDRAGLEAIEDLIADSDHVRNEYGLAVERAIDAYLEAWPIYR